MSKESVYDREVNPLMAKIIAICKKHKIAMFASFALSPTTDDDQIACTTALLDGSHDPPEMLLDAYRVMFREDRSPLMITTRDKDGKIISSEAIL